MTRCRGGSTFEDVRAYSTVRLPQGQSESSLHALISPVSKNETGKHTDNIWIEQKDILGLIGAGSCVHDAFVRRSVEVTICFGDAILLRGSSSLLSRLDVG